ncbi:MAG: SRPBCC domain-containing protein [Gammaproteobacteria bacterium]|nr:SRPBCC domain-containing protein [Gammaproteobacteria bacterium]
MYTDKLTARARTRIRKSPAEAFAAFADADKMSKFWFTRRDDGLVEGEPCTWYLGSGNDAFAFDVQVIELREPTVIVIEWVGPDGITTRVRWDFEETDDGDTILTIEESGFAGTDEAIVERALDSTGGFNQVLIAAKALIEHDVSVNVVADHA